MKKTGLLLIILVIVLTGKVFAQDDETNRVPKNTVSIDLGPMWLGLGTTAAFASQNTGSNFTGFGIAAQYERQISPRMSLGARFSYLWFGLSMDFGAPLLTYKFDMSTMSLEGHFRFYPGGKTFFIGSILGYGNILYQGTLSQQGGNSVSVSVLTNYLKVGPRLGWRFDFGEPGGFILETSFGFDGAFLLGDSSGTQFKKLAGNDVNIGDTSIFDFAESFLFVGGPRMTLSLGWRF